MLKFKQKELFGLFLVLLIFVALLWSNSVESNDIYTAISNNLRALGRIYQEVTKRYVDKVDPDKFLKSGINGMLNTLDPYTSYIEKESKEQLQILTHGKYEGVGMGLIYRNGFITVIDPPFAGTPAARAGIREGDKIIKVDGTPTKELGYEETIQHIRGPAGTEVTLMIQREGEQKLLEFTLIREQITIEDVQYADMVNDSIGYIRLTRFSKNAGSEVAEAINNFSAQNLKGLVLDLRSNPGGMLESAVEVSDLFLPKDLLIVSTRGRLKESIQEFKSIKDPLYAEGPLVLLVNGNSASASEIVSGAIQDHDRGIILGDTTFGKGLVQTVIPLTQDAALKITTAKYYTPSGRCIQKRNYSSWTDSTDNNKDIAVDYRTDNGRSVHGGGGISPDIVAHPQKVNNLIIDLRRKSLFFNFAVHYANTHTELDSNFQIDDKLLQEFRQYLKEKSFKYDHPLESGLSALKSEALKNGYGASLLKDIENLQKSLDRTKEEMYLSSKEYIRKILWQELASKFFGTKREVEISLEHDEVFQKALNLISDKALYNDILKKMNNLYNKNN